MLHKPNAVWARECRAASPSRGYPVEIRRLKHPAATTLEPDRLPAANHGTATAYIGIQGGGEESIFCPFVNHARDQEQAENRITIEDHWNKRSL